MPALGKQPQQSSFEETAFRKQAFSDSFIFKGGPKTAFWQPRVIAAGFVPAPWSMPQEGIHAKGHASRP